MKIVNLKLDSSLAKYYDDLYNLIQSFTPVILEEKYIEEISITVNIASYDNVKNIGPWLIYNEPEYCAIVLNYYEVPSFKRLKGDFEQFLKQV